MARSSGSGTGKKTEPAASDPSGEARAATLDRIAAKIERLSPQRRALREAMRQFGDDFDAKAWSEAFLSPETDAINRVHAVTGGYLALVNNTVEAIVAGAALVGANPPTGMRGASGALEAIRIDGGFTKRQAETFTELYHTRDRLQHSSPDVEPDELHRQVRLLLRHLPRLMRSYVGWLRRYGVEL